MHQHKLPFQFFHAPQIGLFHFLIKDFQILQHQMMKYLQMAMAIEVHSLEQQLIQFNWMYLLDQVIKYMHLAHYCLINQMMRVVQYITFLLLNSPFQNYYQQVPFILHHLLQFPVYQTCLNLDYSYLEYLPAPTHSNQIINFRYYFLMFQGTDNFANMTQHTQHKLRTLYLITSCYKIAYQMDSIVAYYFIFL